MLVMYCYLESEYYKVLEFYVNNSFYFEIGTSHLEPTIS